MWLLICDYWARVLQIFTKEKGSLTWLLTTIPVKYGFPESGTTLSLLLLLDVVWGTSCSFDAGVLDELLLPPSLVSASLFINKRDRLIPSYNEQLLTESLRTTCTCNIAWFLSEEALILVRNLADCLCAGAASWRGPL